MTYQPGTKAVVYTVILTPIPTDALPGYLWPADWPQYVGTGDTLTKADANAVAALKLALG